ncbi:MAG TPA: hypothetical protein VMW54_09665 [Terriglobia bacterium]|nr:hypothetical protein [Terriglobia bacterium]
MRALLAIPLLAGVLFPPLLSAQYRLAPRSYGPPPARPSRQFVPRLQMPAPPDTTGGNFSAVRPFPAAANSIWSKPSPFRSLRPGHGRGRSHGQGFILIDSLPLGYGYSYLNSSDAPAFYPSLWSPIDQEYIQERQIGHGDTAGEVASQQNDLLSSQIQALSREVESLSRKTDSPAPETVSRQAAAQTKSIPASFVYRDGRVIEAADYAIFGHTLWIFGAETTHRIPLSRLDLSATQKLNDERGVDVALPGAR